MKPQKQPPSDVGNAILAHVGRYRMSTPSIVCELPEVQHRRRRHVRHELTQLCRAGYLATGPLFRNRRYYFLASACRDRTHEQGSNEYRIGPLSEIAKIRNYAMLSFCCSSQHRRQRLTADDFEQHFPDMYRPGVPLNYYIDAATSQPRLGFVRVDTGGRGRWDRILEKARADIEAHWIKPEIRPFIERGLFEITVVTALPQKASRLTQALDNWTDNRKSLIRICVCADLINLIAPPPS